MRSRRGSVPRCDLLIDCETHYCAVLYSAVPHELKRNRLNPHVILRRRCDTDVPIVYITRDGRPRFSIVALFLIGMGRKPHFYTVVRLPNQKDGTL